VAQFAVPRGAARARVRDRDRTVPWRAALLLLIAGGAVYLNALHGPFVLDDHSAIVDNAAIRSLSAVPDVFVQRNTPIAGRPVVGATLAANYAIGGLNVVPYHATNILIHLACALLVFGIARRTFRGVPNGRYAGNADALAFATALIWVVHPLNSEVVDYTTQRSESLMAFFLLLTLYAALRSHGDRGAAWPILAGVSCALGMGCKESMVVAPILVVLYDRTFLFDSFREALAARTRLYVTLAASWVLLAGVMWRGPRSGSVGLHHVAPPTYLVNQIRMVARYLRLSLWPADLVVNYGPVDASLRLPDVWLPALVLTVLSIIAVVLLRRRPRAAFLVGWIVLTLAPASSIVPIVTEVGAERRMYLPLIGVVALLIVAVYHVAALRARVPRVAAWTVVGVVALAAGAATIVRNRDYSSGLALAESTLRHWPTDVAHGMVGAELMSLHRDDQAIPELRLAARSDPRARYNLGASLFNAKQYDAAVRELVGVADASPERDEAPLARRLAGRAYALQRNWLPAIDQLTQAVSAMPSDDTSRTWLAHALNGQALTLAQERRFDEAGSLFQRAAELDPGRVDIRRNLASALLDAGNVAAAEREARQAIANAPGDAESYALLGRALALQDKWDAAVEQLRRASQLAPDNARIRTDLDRVLTARQPPR
jgi:protein O-mannosyl-transferase